MKFTVEYTHDLHRWAVEYDNMEDAQIVSQFTVDSVITVEGN